MASFDSNRYMLRHTLATLAYRAGKAMRGAPGSFAQFRVGDDGRTAVELVTHMGNLFQWALSMVKGNETWYNPTSLPWDEEVARFFGALEAFDAYLASEAPLHCTAERLFQGPIADAFTHTGQLAMLRRISGNAMKGENYSLAKIEVGRVGIEQSPSTTDF